MKLCLYLLFLLFGFTALNQVCEKQVFHFKSGRFQLNDEKRDQIDSILQMLHPDSTYLIEIQGHTDKHGSDEKNIRLSEKRVKSVRDYVLAKRSLNIVFFAKGHGEQRLISDDSKDNRRVVVYALPINSDRTVYLKSDGDVKIKLKVPVEYFSYCGVCDSFPKIETVVNRSGGDYEVDIVIDNYCFSGRDSVFRSKMNCISAEYRFPLQYYKEFGNIKVPKPIYSFRCNSSILQRERDSINVKDDDRFQARIDTVTQEYVVTRTCYKLGLRMACCFRKFCHEYEFRFPGQYDEKLTVFSIYNSGRPDIIVNVTDTIRYGFLRCTPVKDKIYGYGLFYSEPLFFKAKIQDLPFRIQYYKTNTIYDLNYGRYLRHIYTIPYDLYKPLAYNDSTLQVKIPKRFKTQEVGYYLTQFDYFVVIDSITTRKFEKEWLDYPFSIRVKVDDQFYVYKTSELKSRFKKRKKKFKVKVKEKNLTEVFELDSTAIKKSK